MSYIATLVLAVLGLPVYFLTVYCWYRIMKKAGYDNLGLIAIIAPLSIVLIIILAFGN